MFDLLSSPLQESEGFRELLLNIDAKRTPCLVSGMCDSLRPFFLISLLKSCGKKGLVVVPEEKDAYRLQTLLETVFRRVYVYPARDFVFENITSYSRENVHERLKVLSAVSGGEYDVVITVPDAVMQYTMPLERLRAGTMKIEKGASYDLMSLIASLESAGYQRFDLVEGPGQYSVHGGVLDVFSVQYPNPVRVDFFGDEADSIGFFDRYTQRTVETAGACEILPCEEFLTDREASGRIQDELSALLGGEIAMEKYVAQIREEMESLMSGKGPDYPDRYAALIYPEKFRLPCAMKDALPVLFDTKRLTDRAEMFFRETEGVCESLASRGLMRMKSGLPLCGDDDFCADFSGAGVLVDFFRRTGIRFRAKTECSIPSSPTDLFTAKKTSLPDFVGPYLADGETVAFLAPNDYALHSLGDQLRAQSVPVVESPERLYPGVVNLFAAPSEAVKEGFTVPSIRFTLLVEASDSYDYVAPKKRKSSSQTEKIKSYTDLSDGDLVVHVNHGIGRFAGIINMTAAGVTRDFIKLVYADGGILYVPCEQMDLVSRYVGSENASLNKLGGAEWKKAKIRARNSASLIAKDLIRLYAERRAIEGFAFPPDDEFQTVFESEFEYEETEGQIISAKEIKRDMERPYPMDRLLCGDVGFGKTEVALRAVFKCVFAGKQAAVLVPTTILALQHYQTISARFRNYPVEVAMVSRFVGKKEQKQALDRLASGSLNIIIGTHRLLQKDVKFKDLGLLIVDEEQRFGVKHKETLKQLSKTVDVLTLSATPIPRTLNMAMSGIRDMSVLEEAPVDRVPVQTFVAEYDETAIAEAIRREFRRGGQVFYLYNYTDSIYGKAAKLKELFPDRQIAVAHGQMDKEELSDVWRRMMDGDIDLLVCTTIIETGVNLPNVNTLIIEDANRMGLSQLHQIRGRVGRSSRKAYAYLTYRKDSILTEVAEKRLQAIQEFTEFGSGFKIAMRDLQLRGAGNILGSEQSGQMETIGYDLYIKILEDAVNLEKGLEPKAERNCLIDLPLDAYIPESYVPSPKVRMDLYKRIGDIGTEADRKDTADELRDRFGPVPKQTETLLDISLLRHHAMDLGFTSIEKKETLVCLFHPSPDHAACEAIARSKELHGKVMFSFAGRQHGAVRVSDNGSILPDCETFLSLYKNFLQKED